MCTTPFLASLIGWGVAGGAGTPYAPTVLPTVEEGALPGAETLAGAGRGRVGERPCEALCGGRALQLARSPWPVGI